MNDYREGQGSFDFSDHVRLKDYEIEKSGFDLRDEGINKAITNADKVHESWSQKAYNLLITYIQRQDRPWLAEKFREDTKYLLPAPPSKRAFGAIIVKAVKAGLIKRVGYEQVTNPKAHRATASLWIKS